MRRTIAADEAHSARNRRTLYLGHLAAAQASVGQPEIGFDLLNEAIQAAETTNERFFEAEFHRLRGETLLTLGKKAEAEIALNRRFGDCSPAAGSLVGIARRYQPCQALAERAKIRRRPRHPAAGLRLVLGRFGMPDLDNAKELLDALAKQSDVVPIVTQVAADARALTAEPRRPGLPLSMRSGIERLLAAVWASGADLRAQRRRYSTAAMAQSRPWWPRLKAARRQRQFRPLRSYFTSF